MANKREHVTLKVGDKVKVLNTYTAYVMGFDDDEGLIIIKFDPRHGIREYHGHRLSQLKLMEDAESADDKLKVAG